MASRLHASYVSIFQRFCDVVAIYLALYAVCIIHNLPLNNYIFHAFLGMVCIFQLIGGLTDFYRSWRGVGLEYELISCLKNTTLSVIVVTSIAIFFVSLSWLLVLQFFISLVILMSIFRILIRVIYSVFFKLFDTNNDVIVVGDSIKAKKLFADLSASKWTGYRPIGLYSFKQAYSSTEFQGNITDITEKIKKSNVRKVYIVMDKYNLQQVDNLLNVLSDTTCSTVVVPDLFNINLLYTRIEDINGTPVIPLFDSRINGINDLLKRFEDILVASIILFFIAPILLVIAIAIKLNSKGPVFFKQLRYGLNGKPILVYKFRTMTVMENGAEVKQAVKNDPRVTSVGRFLRKTSLDELPQFFNVIIGNMSVVGPRPHAIAHNEEYRSLISGYMLRHKVKPGITGLAQIKGWRGETDTLDKMEKRIECDLEYIRKWSLWLDLKIIFLTIFHGFIHKAAY